MWTSILTIVHIAACIFLVVVVLLQTGKGADVSAVFGGSSQTIFGSSGAGNFLTRLTTAIAVVFMLTSLLLTYGTAKQPTRSIFDDVSVPPPSESTTLPTAPPTAEEKATTPTSEAPQEQLPSASTAEAPATAATGEAMPAQSGATDTTVAVEEPPTQAASSSPPSEATKKP